jgi:hypothetical protein
MKLRKQEIVDEHPPGFACGDYCKLESFWPWRLEEEGYGHSGTPSISSMALISAE